MGKTSAFILSGSTKCIHEALWRKYMVTTFLDHSLSSQASAHFSTGKITQTSDLLCTINLGKFFSL